MRDERRPAGLLDFWSRSWWGAARCGREHHFCMGAVLRSLTRSLALSRSEGRACTRELLSPPLEICYSTTFLLQSPSSCFSELGGQHPTESPSLSEQPPKERMQIYSSLITQIHKSFPNRGNYPNEALLKSGWNLILIQTSHLILKLSEKNMSYLLLVVWNTANENISGG